ncbi:hypothetical protein [Streptomyces sp. NPDC093591]|uniref:hypothetical protein n=1 Tax=Streptomyces sp. NPDC093591 TaxID=3366044 RepID=UPI00380ACB48
MPDQYGTGGSAPRRRAPRRRAPRRRARRRTVVVATVLVPAVAAGTVTAVERGLLPFGSSCQDVPVRLTLAAQP